MFSQQQLLFILTKVLMYSLDSLRGGCLCWNCSEQLECGVISLVEIITKYNVNKRVEGLTSKRIYCHLFVVSFGKKYKRNEIQLCLLSLLIYDW